MAAPATNFLDDPVARLLLDGEAQMPSEVERVYLKNHLNDIVEPVRSPLSEEEFRSHPFTQILFSHGSRGWEDSLR